MNFWRTLVESRESRLAAESDPVKVADGASVGLNFLVDEADPEDLAGLFSLVDSVCAAPDSFFAADGDTEYVSRGRLLNYSTLTHDLPEHPNRQAHALLHHTRRRDRAVVLLPYWNSTRASVSGLAGLLARAGIACLQLSLPYHDERQSPGRGFAREMASENLGHTIQANRQAVVDARAALTWLEMSGYRRLGVVGISIGSSVASIVASLDSRVRAAAFLLMADDFGEVVWTGTATAHVRASLERRFSLDEVRRAWRIISPGTYAGRLASRRPPLLIISGRYDQVFIPALARRYVKRLREHGLKADWREYGCGHYTLGMQPYGLRAVGNTIGFLRRAL